MRVAMGELRSVVDVIRALRQLGHELNAQWHWCGEMEADPAKPAAGDVWLRTDLPALRIRVVDHTYEVVLSEV